MSDRLPEIIDPLVFAERRIELKGKLTARSMSRLSSGLLNDSGMVEVELFFNKRGKFSFIDGWAKGLFQMQCQSCLESVDVPVIAVIKLGAIAALELADELPEGYEPLLVDGDKMLLKEIVEDELLLALPTFPKHAEPCVEIKPITKLSVAKSDQVKQDKVENPFAILANFKITGDKNGSTKK